MHVDYVYIPLIFMKYDIYFYLFFRNRFSAMLPANIPKTKYKLQFTEGTEENKFNWIYVKFTLHDFICFVSFAIIGSFYLYNKVFFVFLFLFLFYNEYFNF